MDIFLFFINNLSVQGNTIRTAYPKFKPYLRIWTKKPYILFPQFPTYIYNSDIFFLNFLDIIIKMYQTIAKNH